MTECSNGQLPRAAKAGRAVVEGQWWTGLLAFHHSKQKQQEGEPDRVEGSAEVSVGTSVTLGTKARGPPAEEEGRQGRGEVLLEAGLIWPLRGRGMGSHLL